MKLPILSAGLLGLSMCAHTGLLAADTQSSSAAVNGATENPHVHGVAYLSITQGNGPELHIHFVSSAINIFGYEHAPRTNAEKEQIDEFQRSIDSTDNLFTFTPGSGCNKRTQTELTFDFIATSGPTLPEVHSDVNINWSFNCAQPAALKGVTTKLFGVYPRMKQLKVHWSVGGRASNVVMNKDGLISLR